MTREEGTGNEDVHRHSSRAGHQRYDQSCNKPALSALDGPCSHDRRHIAAESHHHRDERLSVQTHLVHHPVHDERTAGHITRVLKQRNEHIKQHDVRQEYKHTADSTDDAVDHQVLQPAVGHSRRHEGSQLLHQPLDPLHRILSDDERTAEDKVKKSKEYRERQPLVCDHCVDLICDCAAAAMALIWLISLSQSTLHECILRIHKRRLKA